MRIVKKHSLEIIDIDLQIKCKLIFAVAKSKVDPIVNVLQKNHELTIKYIKTI